MLVATLDDERAYDVLAGIARKGGVMYVPVVAAPRQQALHTLEVRGPKSREVLTLLAEVLGPTTERGAPLRLRFPELARITKTTHGYDAAVDAVVDDAPPASVRGPTDPFLGRAFAAGKLTIEACVGEGGAGTVYRALHRDLQMHVAVKVMHESFQRDPKYCKQFHAEALSASRLDHANLTRVLDFGQEPDGVLYIAMEFLDGRSLRDVLEEDGPMPFDRAAQILAMVCSGLTHAHARSIVHRDIKPENIVLVRGLDDDGRETEIAKVCDFGIAHKASEGNAVFAGTAEYISPEQFRGEEPDVQSDVYACGVVLYELLTGGVPIAGDFPEIVKRVLETTPEAPSRRMPGLDPRIDRLVLKAIAKDREVRHASVRELRTEIRALAEDIAVFSTGGGYYDEPQVPSVRARQASIVDAGTPDWLEHGNGYLASLVPSAPSPPPAAPASSAPPVTHRSSGSQAAVRPAMPSRPSSSKLEVPSMGPTSVGPASIVPGSHVSMTPSMSPEASETARNVAAFVKRLVDTHDPAAFAALVGPIEPKVRALFEAEHTGPTWRVCSALEMIAREKSPRAEHALRLLEVFSDRQLLAPLAEKALDFLSDKDGSARKLVVRAGNRGAHALYSARLKHSVFEARERFVAMLIEIGQAGLPTIRAGLERLEPKLGVPGALGMAEDLLRAAPEVLDDELGQIVARYVRSNVNSLAHLATLALPKVWGARARPLLVGQVHHKNDDVAVAAIKRLRTLGGIDRELLEQLRPLVMGAPGARPPVRLAATEALESTTPEAMPEARQLLAEALAAAQGSTPDVEDAIVMLANTLVSVGGDVTLVASRWRQSHTWLRTRLEAVLKRAKLPSR